MGATTENVIQTGKQLWQMLVLNQRLYTKLGLREIQRRLIIVYIYINPYIVTGSQKVIT